MAPRHRNRTEYMREYRARKRAEAATAADQREVLAAADAPWRSMLPLEALAVLAAAFPDIRPGTPIGRMPPEAALIKLQRLARENMPSETNPLGAPEDERCPECGSPLW